MKSAVIFFITVVIISSIFASQFIQSENGIKTFIENSVPYVGTEIPRIEGFDGTGIKIAVIDTGVDFNHPDLFGWGPDGKVIGGYNFIQPNQLPMNYEIGFSSTNYGAIYFFNMEFKNSYWYPFS